MPLHFGVTTIAGSSRMVPGRIASVVGLVVASLLLLAFALPVSSALANAPANAPVNAPVNAPANTLDIPANAPANATANTLAIPANALALVQCPQTAKLTWTPSVPKAGALFEVRSMGANVTLATLAGEPLHFARRADIVDTLFAIAAAPVDSASGLTLEYSCGGGTSSTLRIPTTSGEYPMEHLTVAPKFSAPSSAALTARMRKESAKAAAVSKNAHETPALWQAPFVAPRPTRITSSFGGGRTFNGTVTSRHMGTDYAGAVGAPVKAVNRGVVRIVDQFYLGGNVIYVDHGAGLVTAYLHLSKQLVAVGDTVKRGQVIGHVGATGRVTGPHLHIIARYGQITADATTLSHLR